MTDKTEYLNRKAYDDMCFIAADEGNERAEWLEDQVNVLGWYVREECENPSWENVMGWLENQYTKEESRVILEKAVEWNEVAF